MDMARLVLKEKNMTYLTNYYKNLCEQAQQRINILEARMIDFGGVVSAFTDTVEDPHRNIATRRNDEEADLSVDELGGQYPSMAYKQAADSYRNYQSRVLASGREQWLDKVNARANYMKNVTYRGKPAREGTKTWQKGAKEFEMGYQTPEELLAQARGREVLKQLSGDILTAYERANPEAHQAFQANEAERIANIRGENTRAYKITKIIGNR